MRLQYFCYSFFMSQMPSRLIIEVSGGLEQNSGACRNLCISSKKSIFHVFLAYIWIKWSLRYASRLSETSIFFYSFFLSQMHSWRIIEISGGREQNILAHAEISTHHRKIEFAFFLSVYLDKMIPEICLAALWDWNIFIIRFSYPNCLPGWLLKFQEARTEFWRMHKFLHIIENRFFMFF